MLGVPPEGEALVDLVLGITRLPQGPVPALRAVVAQALGFDPRTERRHEVDKIEAECRDRVEPWPPPAGPGTWTPRTRRAWWSTGSAPGWSGPAATPTRWPTRCGRSKLRARRAERGTDPGAAHVLPTGRNLYSVDPKALPSALSWRWAGPGRRPGRPARGRDRRAASTTVGLVLWGTAP